MWLGTVLPLAAYVPHAKPRTHALAVQFQRIYTFAKRGMGKICNYIPIKC